MKLFITFDGKIKEFELDKETKEHIKKGTGKISVYLGNPTRPENLIDD
jgi:hypothetical protein